MWIVTSEAPKRRRISDRPDAPEAVDMKALKEAFVEFTRTTETMETAYTQLQEHVTSLDRELQDRNRDLALTTDYLNSILDSMSDGVIAVNTDGIITTFNRAAETILDYRSEEVLRKSYRQIFGRELGKTHHLQAVEIPAKEGDMIPVSEKNSTISDREGRDIGSMKVFQDLSEIEALRKQVRRKDRLAAIGEMAATVAHEIRNPLGGIRGFASLLQRDIPGDDPRSRLVEKILTGTKSLDRGVGDLLEYTRPIELHVKRVGVAELVETASGYLALDGKAISVEIDVDDSLEVAVDPDRIRDVFLNILLNSVQSIEGTGTVNISAASSAAFVTVNITDTGAGIAPKDLEHIFSPFFTTKEKGTGLGLAVASKTVESHGGEIQVTSNDGNGTTFLITLPRGD